MKLDGKNIAILATNGFEQSELMVPMETLRKAGAKVHVVSPEEGEIKGWEKDNWGKTVPVDVALKDASVDDYDALVLPGGQINPDLLRVNPQAVQFVRAFWDTNKLIAAICHAPWLLIEADIVTGLRATSYPSIRKDMINASANWVDEEVVLDQAVITSRNPGDLEAFCDTIIEEMSKKPAFADAE